MKTKLISAFAFILAFSTFNAQEKTKDSIVQKQETSIQEVIIRGKKPLIKTRIDGLVYDLQSDPESKSKNLLEMMKKMPYLSVDSNENILFKGNTNFKILINGKETQLLTNNPKDVLKSMPANTVQNIEIITNPSSKYEAEGALGMINIITTKKTKDGYNASVNLGSRFPKQEHTAGFSLNVQKKKVGISMYGGGLLKKNPEINYKNYQTTASNNLEQNGTTSGKGNSVYFNINGSYEIDSLHLLNVQLGSSFANNESKDLLNSNLFQQNSIIDNNNSINNSQSNGKGFETSANYQIGFKNDKSKLLTLSYRFNNYHYNVNSNNHFQYNIFKSINNINQNNDNQNSEHTFQIDFVKNIKKIDLETGLKAILRNNGSHYTEIPQNILNSDQFSNKQSIYGAYFTTKFSLFDWNFQTGLRLESTDTSVNFTSTNTEGNQNYFNLIPNISFGKSWKGHHSGNVGFSRRIKRPGILRLNPFVNQSNPYFQISGNPYLKPVVNNDVMANYSYNHKISLNFGLGYSFSNKIDLKVSTYDPATNITKTTFENSGSVERLGLDYNLNYPITKKLTLSVNGNSALFLIKGEINNVEVENNIFTYYTYLSVNYQFENNWNVSSSLEINSEMPAGLQSKTNSYTGTSFRFSKSILENQLSISAYIYNPFNKFRKVVTVNQGIDFYQKNYVNDFYRSFGFNITYKFGRLKQEFKETKRKIENNDLAN